MSTDPTTLRATLALAPAELRHVFDCSAIGCATTAELVGEQTIIGQPRGVQAISFGIGMASPGYNIFVLGESGTGRTTAIQRYVEARAAQRPAAQDWIYVNNFGNPHRPAALALPAGDGARLRDGVRVLIDRLRRDVAQAFDNQAFRDEALEQQHEADRRREGLFDALNQQAAALNAAVVRTAEGFRILPAADGQPLPPEQLGALSVEEIARWRDANHTLQHALNEVLFRSQQLEREAQAAVLALVRRVAGTVVDGAIAELKENFARLPQLSPFFDALHQDILDNVDLFRGENAPPINGAEPPPPQWYRRYRINVLVDRAGHSQAPVVVEYNPSVPRLLGRVEHEARHGGAVVTDFTLLRAGALHAANGGYLVLRAADLFDEPGAWDALKRALLGAAIRPDDPAIRGGAATRSLDPEPIPLAVKVILIGAPQLYYYLLEKDDDFSSLFKIMADFDAEVTRSPENEMAYARFVATLCAGEGLCHLDAAAVGRLIEHGSRLAGTQQRLSARFGQIADLVREADYWARDAGRELALAADVDRAIENRIYLRNRAEMRRLEMQLEGKHLLSTAGEEIGQINALSVSQIGEHVFGQASRVTVRTYVGTSGVVQIDREVALAGPIHNKGILTLVGYLGGQYAADHPLSLAAQITFEQNYGAIDGDSASSTELYALLSSLAEVPINQAIAVTGSVNQRGEVQAIGGVTHKVEGWFALCRQRGLSGSQGVLIPAANAGDLMLDNDVMAAVAAGTFHVWAVASVDEGLALLTGRSAGELHARVQARLAKLAAVMREYDS